MAKENGKATVTVASPASREELGSHPELLGQLGGTLRESMAVPTTQEYPHSPRKVSLSEELSLSGNNPLQGAPHTPGSTPLSPEHPTLPGALTLLGTRPSPTAPHLQRDDDHKDLLVLVREDVLDEGPTSANECDGDEQQCPLQAGGEESRVQGPRVATAVCLQHPTPQPEGHPGTHRWVM